jgi:hypothetical protein
MDLQSEDVIQDSQYSIQFPSQILDNDDDGAQFQNAQPRSSYMLHSTQSTGTIVGDDTSPAEVNKGLIVPRTKKRRDMEVPRAKELDFTEDNGDALLILLRIAHLQFEDISEEEMALDSLLHLAVLCDMYDCAKLVKPWLSHWCNFENLEYDPDAALEMLLFISSVFKKDSVVDFRIRAAKTIALKPSEGYVFQNGRDPGEEKLINMDYFPSKELCEFEMTITRILY